jgi:hypothetical protein
MGIDGIGKPAPPKIGGAEGGSSVGSRDTFQVDGPTEAAAPAGSEALGRLQKGEISVDEYLEGRIEDAVGHLTAQLSPQQLEFVKETLREQLSHDPVLTELVRRTTA